MERRRFNKRKAGRIAVALGLGVALGTFAPPPDDALPPRALPGGARMLVEAVPLDAHDPARRRVGALAFVAGYRLRSHDRRFGGISAIYIEAGEVVALSDAGTAFRFPVPTGAGEAPLAIMRLPKGPGTGRRKSDRDAESLVVRGRTAWIGYEGRNAVWRYRLPDWTFEAAAAPQAMRDWPNNGGGEAMVRLADGRFIVFSEGEEEGGPGATTPALLFPRDPALQPSEPLPIRYKPPEGHRVTDAALLPDGRILFLNRRVSLFDGVSAILSVAPAPAAIRREAVLEARAIATLAAPLTVDNMEALSVTREGRRTILWIASDDNLNPLLQQTLLLKFALEE
jgi:hypothetical protein